MAPLLALWAVLAASGTPWALPPEGRCTPSGGLRGWPVGEDAPPIQFQTGEVLDAGKLDLLRSYLPPEIWEHRERFFFEGMALEIGPCFRDDGAPDFFVEATEKFRGQARLLENGGLADHTAGLAFPPDTIDPEDALAGLRWAWNVQSRYRAGGFRGRFRISDLVGRIGYAEPFEGEVFQNQLARRADRPGDGYRVPDSSGHLWVAGGRFYTPFRAREFAWLQFRDPESHGDPARSDDLHVYIPELRKVRRAPAQSIEGVFMPSFGVGVQVGGSSPAVGLGGAGIGSLGAIDPGTLPDTLQPRRSGFEGLELRPLLYHYRLLGVHDVLAPINAVRPAWPEDELRAFGPYGLAWASDRWDLRRTLVLEGTKRESPTGESELAVMRLWVDLQTLYPLYYVAYDKKGEQIDVGYYVGRWSEDREDYPRWSDDPERPVRALDPVGEAFANLHLKGSWRRESWTIVSVPESDNAVRRTLSLRSLQRGK